MKSELVRRVILLLLGLALYITPVSSQSADNPAIFEGLRVYNTNNTKEPFDNSSQHDVLAISQDFQTIYALNDQSILPWRIVMDYSTSCNSSNTTVEQLSTLNHDNLGFYSTIRDKSIVAVVERGGCNWSEKVYMARSLSSAMNLSLATIVISDNETVASANYQPYETISSSQKFIFTDPLPANRNASQMKDNDLQSTFGTTTPPTSIYFIPKSYGDHLRTVIANNTTNVGNDTRTVLQLCFIFTPYWVSSDGGNNAFTRGYLSYVIALSVILFIAICAGFVFLRWWRIRERRAAREYEAQLSAHAANMQMRRKSKPLPVNIVNAIPIAHYSESTVKNPSCAICLEDYQEGETEVRILGCGHGFCVLCIDPWLTQKSTLCPICKWDCLPENMRKSSTDTSDSDTGDHSGTPTAAASNTTILANSTPSSSSLTSTQQQQQQSQEKSTTPIQHSNNGEQSTVNVDANKTSHDDKSNETTLENDNKVTTTTTTTNTTLEHDASSSESSILRETTLQQKDTEQPNMKADHPDDASKNDPITTAVASTSDDTHRAAATTHVDTIQSPPMTDDSTKDKK